MEPFGVIMARKLFGKSLFHFSKENNITWLTYVGLAIKQLNAAVGVEMKY